MRELNVNLTTSAPLTEAANQRPEFDTQKEKAEEDDDEIAAVMKNFPQNQIRMPLQTDQLSAPTAPQDPSKFPHLFGQMLQ